METVQSLWRDCVTRHVDASSQDACPPHGAMLEAKHRARSCDHRRVPAMPGDPGTAQERRGEGSTPPAQCPSHTNLPKEQSPCRETKALQTSTAHASFTRQRAQDTRSCSSMAFLSIQGCGMINARSVPSTTGYFALMCEGMVNQRFRPLRSAEVGPVSVAPRSRSRGWASPPSSFCAFFIRARLSASLVWKETFFFRCGISLSFSDRAPDGS